MDAVTQTVLRPKDLGSANLADWIECITRFDAAGWPLVLVGNCDARDPLDGLAMAAFCAARTKQIGICAVIDAEIVEPFTLARGLATLDHMSGGRAAWRIASYSDEERSLELIETTRKLLKSWEVDALIEDRASGILSDSAKVGLVAHEGTYFQVEGPLNIPRPPQGAVPLIALGDEGAIADVADLVLNHQTVCTISLEETDLVPPPVRGAGRGAFLARLEAR